MSTVSIPNPSIIFTTSRSSYYVSPVLSHALPLHIEGSEAFLNDPARKLSLLLQEAGVSLLESIVIKINLGGDSSRHLDVAAAPVVCSVFSRVWMSLYLSVFVSSGRACRVSLKTLPLEPLRRLRLRVLDTNFQPSVPLTQAEVALQKLDVDQFLQRPLHNLQPSLTDVVVMICDSGCGIRRAEKGVPEGKYDMGASISYMGPILV